MWAGRGGGEVYSGVATSGTATQPLMLLPSTARCRCSVREPSVLASELNGKPVGAACLRGPVVSPLLHTDAGICLWPGRLPALGGGVEVRGEGGVGVEARGATTFWPRIVLCMYLCGPVHACASAVSKYLPFLLNEHLPVFSRSRSAAMGSALMGHLPLHQGYSLQTLKNSEGQGVFSLEEKVL